MCVAGQEQNLRATFDNTTLDYAGCRIVRVTSLSEMEVTFIKSNVVASGKLGMFTEGKEMNSDIGQQRLPQKVFLLLFFFLQNITNVSKETGIYKLSSIQTYYESF
jgi:hypothetical protein